jgi:hypothetical protein
MSSHPSPPTPARPPQESSPLRPVDRSQLAPRRLPDAEAFRGDERTLLERRLRSGEVRRVRRGVFVAQAETDGPAAARQSEVLAEMRGVANRLTTPFWFSHANAALLWGCWTWRLAAEVHVTQLGHPKVRRDDRVLRRHWTDLPLRDRCVLDGLPVTGLERTVVDCLRGLREPQGIVVADSALRIGARTEVLETILTESAGKRGIVRARRVLAAADGRSESPGESLVRWFAADAGLPVLDVSIPVATWLGEFWLDLGWPELRIGIEFDGAVKYSGGRYGEPGERLFAEKRRQDALVEAGWTIVRITWADLSDPARLVARLRSARERARMRPRPR